MTQRPRAPAPPPSSYNSPWAHSYNAASDPALSLGLGRPQATRSHSDRFGIPPRRPSHPVHYPPSSTMLNSEPVSGPSTPKTALKVFTSVKRSFSLAVTKKPGLSASFTNSTAEETAAAQIRITAEPVTSKPPPTVQQIAAGLVTARRPARTPLARRRSSTLPPPPMRSSLKKPIDSSLPTSSSTSLASTSLMSTRTGSTTTAATSLASSRKSRPRFNLKDAFFGRSSSASPPPILPIVPKAVRFHVDRTPIVGPTSLPPT